MSSPSRHCSWFDTAFPLVNFQAADKNFVCLTQVWGLAPAQLNYYLICLCGSGLANLMEIQVVLVLMKGMPQRIQECTLKSLLETQTAQVHLELDQVLT